MSEPTEPEAGAERPPTAAAELGDDATRPAAPSELELDPRLSEAPGDAPAPVAAAPVAAKAPPHGEPTDPAERVAWMRGRPSYLFFGVVAGISLLLDLGSKAWAEIELSRRTLIDPSITLIPDHLMFTLAYNKGGAWGLLQDANENLRRPFFLIVSVLAIAFIVSLYNRLSPEQRALKWGLPLVLGGALGNLSDRITRSGVVDFIDYRADWIESMNRFIAKYAKGWSVTDHWPTFNVADVFICIGVALMAVDMVTSRRSTASEKAVTPPPAPTPPEAIAPEAAPSVTESEGAATEPERSAP